MIAGKQQQQQQQKTSSTRCDHVKTTFQRSLSNSVAGTTAEVRFRYDHNDC